MSEKVHATFAKTFSVRLWAGEGKYKLTSQSGHKGKARIGPNRLMTFDEDQDPESSRQTVSASSLCRGGQLQTSRRVLLAAMVVDAVRNAASARTRGGASQAAAGQRTASLGRLICWDRCRVSGQSRKVLMPAERGSFKTDENNNSLPRVLPGPSSLSFVCLVLETGSSHVSSTVHSYAPQKVLSHGFVICLRAQDVAS